MSDPTADLPHALGGPVGRGAIKLSPEDFVVEEVLGFEPSGEGEHVYLRIEKCGENTDFLARKLARFAGVPVRDVSYAGLKDRHGRTIQWFSVQLPGQSGPDWSDFESESVRVLEVQRNARKLRRGAVRANRFELTVQTLDAPIDQLQNRLSDIATHGVPNYFGPQRFGHEGRNIDRAREFFSNPRMRIDAHKRGLYLSAARSLLFNAIAAERVRAESWNRPISGDVFMFADSHSFFKPDAENDTLLQRVEAAEIHPSGVLWGKEASTATGAALALELSATRPLADLAEGLERAKVETGRRPLRVCPEAMSWSFPQGDRLRVAFTLPAGAYATVVLRECLTTDRFEV